MAIQFPCSGCGNQLSVPDDAAGKKARCPQCSTVLDVPAQAAPGDLPGGEFHLRPPEPAPSPFPSAPGAAPQKPNPYAENPYASPKTGYEEFGKSEISPTLRPTTIMFEDVMGHAWKLYMNNLGMVLGAVMVAYVITLVLGWILGFMNQIVMIAMGNNDAAIIVSIFLMFFVYVLQFAVATFLNVGVWRILLDVCRGKYADFGRLFSGGDLFLPMFGAFLLFLLMQIPALLLFVIPWIIVWCVFGQYPYLIVDQRLGVLEAFSASIEITRGNRWTIFGIYVVSLGIYLACFITCIPVAAIFFGPYISLVWTVMYLKMAGQPLAKVA